MPKLAYFSGLTIRYEWEDNRRHHKPHIHVYSGTVKGSPSASIALDGEIFEMDSNFPVKKLAEVGKWLGENQDELYMEWENVVRRQAVSGIGPFEGKVK